MKLLSSLLVIIIVLSVVSCEDYFKNQVKVYPVLKNKEESPLPLNRTTYKVFPESQTVIYWDPGIDEVPKKLSKCTVRDRLHWCCEYSDGSDTLMMDGERFEIRPADEHYQYVSWWKWWILHIGLKFK